jgi:hypothetical protein
MDRVCGVGGTRPGLPLGETGKGGFKYLAELACSVDKRHLRSLCFVCLKTLCKQFI